MKKTLVLLLSIIAVAGFAQKSEIRVELDASKDKIPLKPIYTQDLQMDNPEWKGVNKEYFLYITSKKIDENWREFALIFTPEKSGKVKLILRGPQCKDPGSKKNLPIWVAYDSIQIIDAECQNPDFEELSVSGVIAGWAGDCNNVVKNTGDARSGNRFAKVCYDLPLTQEITVKKDHQVTIKFSVKTLGKDGTVE
jgi:hypothetical protein